MRDWYSEQVIWRAYQDKGHQEGGREEEEEEKEEEGIERVR